MLSQNRLKKYAKGIQVALIHIIDDHNDVRQLLQFALKQEGYEVSLSHDGQSALKVLESESPDLILSDLHMPQMDGYQLFMRIREMPHLRETPFVCITGQHDEKERRRAMELGVDDFIFKPIDADELVALVQAQLRKSEEQGAYIAELVQKSERRRQQLLRRVALMCYDLSQVLDQNNDHLQALLEGADPQHHVQALMQQQRKSERLLNSVRHWLWNLNTLEQISLRPVKLQQLAQEVCEDLRVQAEEKNLVLKMELEEAQVLGEQNLVYVAIYQLLHNAIAYTPEAGQVFVRIQRHDEQLELQVQDTGPGFGEQQLKNLFRFVSPAQEDDLGKGVGLILTQEMMEYMNGSLQARNTDEGACVSLTFVPIQGDAT